jgi:hypothetical protein
VVAVSGTAIRLAISRESVSGWFLICGHGSAITAGRICHDVCEVAVQLNQNGSNFLRFRDDQQLDGIGWQNIP